MITFLLNQEIRREDNLSPNMTVLNYLRTKINKTGTKEGCGSGDCGACTVVLGEVVDGQLQYRSVNSCLTFVSALHGKQLITVEDLQNRDRSLHPVQKAVVDFHGSQCGYCTPGFIMSMFALGKNKPDASKEDVMESLAGNLCRCTCYRPIFYSAMLLSSSENWSIKGWSFESDIAASTFGGYPVQRHSLPASDSMTSSLLASGLFLPSANIDMMKPGVQ